MMTLYRDLDKNRYFDESAYRHSPGYRSDEQRDLDRLIHSTCFRRLQGKTQLYPGLESDFFRNRLTHSLEVAQIAKSIATKINAEYKVSLGDNQISKEIVEFAGLAHDIGHPPFGHQGEEMLDELMKEFGGYEGNAQTLRILTRIEKKGLNNLDIESFNSGVDQRVGLNLTARTLASVLKYDKPILFNRKDALGDLAKPQKGYYESDSQLIGWIKKSTGGHDVSKKFKTVECRIMDLADDIAYSIYDLEDALKAGFYTMQDVLLAPKKLRETIAAEATIKPEGKTAYKITGDEVGEILQNLFASLIPLKSRETRIPILLNLYHEIFQEFSVNGYARSYLTSSIVNHFIEGVRFEIDESFPAQSKVYFEEDILKEVEVLKKFTYTSQVLSSRLKVAEYRGKEIVNEIFTALTDNKKQGFQLLPTDFRRLYDDANIETEKKRIICDYVAGMTDRYAIEFYGRLKSESPETIFKPL